MAAAGQQRVAELEQRNAELEQRNAEHEQRNVELEQRNAEFKADSATPSSKQTSRVCGKHRASNVTSNQQCLVFYILPNKR